MTPEEGKKLVAAQHRQMEINSIIKMSVNSYKPNGIGAYRVIITFDQVLALREHEPELRGIMEWWIHRDYRKLEVGERADICTRYTWFVEQTTGGAWILYLSPKLDIHKKAYQIEPPTLDRQRNALRVEFIPPSPRCILKPETEQAEWVLINRPLIVDRLWTQFGYCVRKSCEFCPIAHYHIPKVQGESNSENRDKKETA